jgi:hypothetical protein
VPFFTAAPKPENSDDDNAYLRQFLEERVTDTGLIEEIAIDGKIQLWVGLDFKSDEAKAQVKREGRVQVPLRKYEDADQMRAVWEDRRRSIVKNVYDAISVVTRSIVKRAITSTK